MPEHIKINVNFQTEDDNHVPPIRRYEHRIAVHRWARQETLRVWHSAQPGEESRKAVAQLKRSLVEHWLAEAERRRREYRFLGAIAAIREAMRIDPTAAIREKLQEAVAIQSKLDDDWHKALREIGQNQLPQAEQTLKTILEIKPDHADAHGRLGMIYASRGQRSSAVEHWQAVARHDPDNAYGHGMLGWLAMRESRWQEALEHFRDADEAEPYNAKIHFQMGLALSHLDELSQAIECFRQTLEIDPDHLEACQCLTLALLQQGRAEEALPFARRAVALTNYEDLDALSTLTAAFAEAGRFSDAADAAARALAIAESIQPALAPQIRSQIKTFRAKAGQRSQ